MHVSAALNKYDTLRTQVFEGRGSLTLIRKLFLALAMAAATGLMAQMRLPLPWTPVPVTGQVLAVLLSGVLLGGRFGAFSQLFYLVLGALGMPWLSGFAAGAGVLAGPTGGYLLGFVPLAYFVGRIIENGPGYRTFPRLYAVMASAVLLFVYLPGVLQLGFWTRGLTGSFPAIDRLLTAGALPFLPGEAAKVLYAALFARAVCPHYGSETGKRL